MANIICRNSHWPSVGRPMVDSEQSKGFFFFATAFRFFSGPARLLSSKSHGLFPLMFSDWGMKLTIHLYLMPRLIIRGAMSPLLHISSCSACLIKGQLYLLYLIIFKISQVIISINWHPLYKQQEGSVQF